MNKDIKFRIIAIVILVIVLSVMLYFYFKNGNSANNFSNTRTMIDSTEITNSAESDTDTDTDTDTDAEEVTVTTKIINTTVEVQSALTEQIELYATKYLEECLVEEDQEISEGDNILEYTDGTYLTAPYDCVIQSLNIPEEEGQCTNEHYIEIYSVNQLAVTANVDETYLENVYVGQEASIEVTVLEDNEYTGYITNISNTASNGNFTVTIEFQNDGDIKIGMSATVTVEAEV